MLSLRSPLYPSLRWSRSTINTKVRHRYSTPHKPTAIATFTTKAIPISPIAPTTPITPITPTYAPSTAPNEENNNNNIQLLALYKQLLSYPSLHAAHKDRQISLDHTTTMNQQLVKDVYTVMRHSLILQQNINRPPTKLLSLEFGQLLHTLVLPHSNRTVPVQLIQPVLDMCVATLRVYQKEAKKLTLDELMTATQLYQKMQSIQLYFHQNHEPILLEPYRVLMRLALNQLLGCYSEWASSQWRTQDEARGILQQAEHFLVRENNNSTNTPEQLLASVTPDLTSFLKLMAAWGNIHNHARATEIYNLIMDLCHDGALTGTPAIVETFLSSSIHGALHIEGAITMVENMATSHVQYPDKYPKPREATLSKLCSVLHYDPLFINSHIERLHAIANTVNIPMNHVLINAVITSYANATMFVSSIDHKLDLCQAMMEYLDQARNSIQNWNSDQLQITYKTAIRAWAECNTKEGAYQAKILWDNAITEHIHLDILTHNQVIRAVHNHSDGPQQAKQVFDHVKKHSIPNLITWKYLLLAYEHHSKTAEDAEQAEAYLNDMMTLRRHQRPNRFIFNSVIGAWTTGLQSLQGVLRADAVLDRLCAEYEHQLRIFDVDPYRVIVQANPLKESFERVVLGYIKYGDASHLARVTDLASRMLQMERDRIEAPSHRKRYMSSVKPSEPLLERIRDMYVKYYTGSEDIEEVMQSLKSTVADKKGFQDILESKSHNKVETMVDLLNKKQAPLHLAATIDRLALYNVALHFIAEAAEGQRSALTAEKILLQMERRNLMPDRITYTNIMKAWTKIATFPAIARAEEHLMTVFDLNLEAADGAGTASLHPSRHLNANCFNIVMNAYLKLKTTDGDDRVRQLYALMVSASKTLPYLVPDNNCIRTIFESASAEYADSMLRELVSQTDEQSDTRVPISFFTLALNKWENSGLQGVGDHAEQILRLQDQYSQLDEDAALTTISYNIVMKALEKSSPIQAERVEYLLEEMWGRQGMVQPDHDSYNTAMRCFQKRANPHDAEKCLNILNCMMDRGTAPTSLSICICMDAIRNSRQPDRVEATEMLFRTFQDKYNAKKEPSPKLFERTLAVLEDPDGDAVYVSRAMKIFNEAVETNSLTPQIFASVMNICNMFLDQAAKEVILSTLMNHCKEVGMISPLTLKYFRDMVTAEVFRDVLHIPCRVPVQNVTLSDLPVEWHNYQTEDQVEA